MHGRQFSPAIRQGLAPLKRTVLLTLALLVATVPVLVLNETATAAEITNRSLQISSGQPSATNNYTFTFTPAQTTQIQSIVIQSCTTALGTCTAPTGINLSGGTISQSGFQGATNFTKDTTTSTPVTCTSTTILCLKRTDTTTQSTSTAHVITDTGAVNQNASNCSAAPNCTFFERITTYSDNGYTTIVDSGTTASSTTQLFTVNAQVEEELSFCVGSTAVNDATTSVPTCSSISGTSLNLGVLNSADVNISPVPTTDNGDNNNGMAELSTNAANGSIVDYGAVQQSGTNHRGALRVAGATCASGASNTDQCINSIASPTIVTAGVEAFGMTVAGVNCSNTTTYYPCSFSGGTEHLNPTANYDCTGSTGNTTYPSNTTDTGQVTGPTGCEYVWDESGTQDTIASASTPVGNEALILKFASTPNLVTPTGTYTAQADFVATPTY